MPTINTLLIAKIFIALGILAGFIAINDKLIDPDLGWHIKVGEEIAGTKTLPTADHYTNTMPGFAWVDHEALINVLLWWLSTHNAWWLAVALFALLAYIPFLTWIIRAQNFGMLWLILLGASSVIPFIGIRPHLFSFVIFFVVFELLYRSFVGTEQKKYLWWLPLIFTLWANVHAGFAGGLILFAAYLAVSATASFWRDKKISMREYAFPGAIFLASFAGTFLNPYGWKLHAMIIEAVTSKEVAAHITEFKLLTSYFDLSLIVMTGIALIFIFRFYKAYPAPVISLAALFFVLAFKSIRHWLLFIVVAEPLLASGVRYFSADIAQANRQKPFLPKTIRRLRIAAVALFFVLAGYFGYKIIVYQGMAVPVQAVSFLREHRTPQALRDTTLFNSYEWGGYLIGQIPDVKVFIDGRMPYWTDAQGNSILAEYMQFFNDERERERILKSRGISMILLSNTSSVQDNFWRTHLPASVQEKIRRSLFFQKLNAWFRDEPRKDLATWLTEHGWTVMYQDPVAIIFTKL